MLTTQETATRLRKHKVTLWKWRQEPDHHGLPFIFIPPRTILYDEDDVERLIDARTVGREVTPVAYAEQEAA
jgi:hypothetical protein